MVKGIKGFRKVQEDCKGVFILRYILAKAINEFKSCVLSGVALSKAVLIREKETISVEVMYHLYAYNFLKNFGYTCE